jgi:hypothetical protein
MTTTPSPRPAYRNFACDVRRGGEYIATARTPNMAKRIAFALNYTRDIYNTNTKEHPKAHDDHSE